MTPHDLQTLLRQVASGTVSPDSALTSLRELPYQDLGFACVDHHRTLRQGCPEVIYAEYKTSDEVLQIAAALLNRGSNLLCTRTPDATAQALTEAFPAAERFPRAGIVRLMQTAPDPSGPVGVLCAGTSDLPVAEEARLTLEFYGVQTLPLYDVGVAGLHRLLSRQSELHRCKAHIVVAGMEGALGSVIGGLVHTPVIAVPTSVGYGANFGGVSALLSMLNSCAAGVTVVNIDNGFGAASAVWRILHASDQGQTPPTSTSLG